MSNQHDPKEEARVINVHRDWQKERMLMADMVRQNILDPIALVAGLAFTCEKNEHFEYTTQDIGKILKLMVEGAHVTLSIYHSPYGNVVSHAVTDLVKNAWDVPLQPEKITWPI